MVLFQIMERHAGVRGKEGAFHILFLPGTVGRQLIHDFSGAEAAVQFLVPKLLMEQQIGITPDGTCEM